MKEKMTYPFSIIENKIIPDPESFILIMISKYRNSGYSDKELARYIAKGLAVTLYQHDAHIEQFQSSTGLCFKDNKIKSNQTSKLKKILKALRLKQ